MPKIMQNLVVVMVPSGPTYDISFKAVNMCMNRFCINEDAGFELSGVHYLDQSRQAKARSSSTRNGIDVFDSFFRIKFIL